MGSAKIPWATNHTYLGILFDNRLTFDGHMNRLVERLKSRLNIMRSITGITWGASPTIMRTFYKQAIRSLVDYAAPALLINSTGPHTKRYQNQMAKLEVTQNQALRLIIAAPLRTKLEIVRREALIPPITEHLRQIAANFLSTMAGRVTNPTALAIRDVLNQTEITPISLKRPISTQLLRLTKLAREWGAKAVAQIPPQTLPPWRPLGITEVVMGTGLKKTEISSIIIRQSALAQIDYLKDKYPEAVNIYTDGSLDPISGRAASAACDPASGQSIQFRVSDFSSTLTTELAAMREGL
jgi:hypothetical protein